MKWLWDLFEGFQVNGVLREKISLAEQNGSKTWKWRTRGSRNRWLRYGRSRGLAQSGQRHRGYAATTLSHPAGDRRRRRAVHLAGMVGKPGNALARSGRRVCCRRSRMQPRQAWPNACSNRQLKNTTSPLISRETNSSSSTGSPLPQMARAEEIPGNGSSNPFRRRR